MTKIDQLNKRTELIRVRLEAVFITLLVLKATGAIDWPWWAIFLPIAAPLLIVICVALIEGFVLWAIVARKLIKESLTRNKTE